MQKPHSILTAVWLAVVVVALAACGGGDPSGSAVDCPAEAPSPAPTQPYADDPELASRIPQEVAGDELGIQTVCATVFDPGGLVTSDEFLERAGVELRDVTIALSRPPEIGRDPTDPYVGITAWRYRGASEEEVRSAFLGLLEESQLPVEPDIVAGKEIHRAFLHAWYVEGDTLYSIIGVDEAVAEALQELP